MRRFDVKFGPELLDAVPTGPGVYQFRDGAGAVIYVGKASNLRRRLSQYRAASAKKRDKKPRNIVKDAVEVSWESTASELDACLEEVRLIQSLRPKHNIAGAYAFLYPYIGLHTARSQWRLCFTTKPELFPSYPFHGAYRSREVTVLGFFALARLLRHVAHPEPASRVGDDRTRDKHSRVVAFRQVPIGVIPLWESFFRGEDAGAVGDLAIRLLEKPSARHDAASVQADLKTLRAFFDTEAAPLRAAVTATDTRVWPVAQLDRDPMFLRFRALTAQRDFSPLDL